MSSDRPPARKVRDLETLPAELGKHRAGGATIVHCHGTFDPLHIGHIRHFEQAKDLGDVLVVTVTPDRFVNKGPHRPVFTEKVRSDAIAALSCVDFVAINDWPMAVETIELLRPDCYVKGSEFRAEGSDLTGAIALEKRAVEAAGGRLAFTDDLTFSASRLVNRHLPVLSDHPRSYLSTFADAYSSEQILGFLDQASRLRVLVVGEAIIDEYHFCHTIGKAGKEPTLAALYDHTEKFVGGTLAVANHVAAFVERVELLTSLGTGDSQEGFVRESLSKNVNPHFLYATDAPTIVKQRFVEEYPLQKLLEIYKMDQERQPQPEQLCAALSELLPQHDVVIVLDCGHGMLNDEAIALLCDQARCLSLSTQINAGNQGYNVVSKYSRADYICVSETEIRAEARSRHRDLSDIVQEVAERLCCPRLLITRGQDGCLAFDSVDGFFEVPAFAGRIVDRVGAGDAVFSLTSLCVARQAPMDIVGFVGNAVGALAVSVMNNQTTIQRVPLAKQIESLLK